MKNLFIIFFATCFMFACKKEKQLSLTESLAQNDWKKTSILISSDSVAPDTIPTIDILTSRPNCAKDNVWHFDANTNTFSLSEGAEKCTVSDPDIKDQGVIEELSNGSQLRVAGTGTNEIWEIESRSSSSFRVSYFARNGANQTAKFRVTFTKI